VPPHGLCLLRRNHFPGRGFGAFVGAPGTAFSAGTGIALGGAAARAKGGPRSERSFPGARTSAGPHRLFPLGRRLLFLLGLLALLGLFGGTPARGDDAPRFLIEKITVQGNRRPASARIVVSESLLKDGRTYGEDELRTGRPSHQAAAVHHRGRLRPTEGSERGRYELVITVEETRPIFVDLEEQGDFSEPTLITSPLQTSRRFDFSNNSALGVREFVGSEGVVFASFGSPGGLFRSATPATTCSAPAASQPRRGLQPGQQGNHHLPLGRRAAHRQPVAAGDRGVQPVDLPERFFPGRFQPTLGPASTGCTTRPTTRSFHSGRYGGGRLDYRRFHSSFKSTGSIVPRSGSTRAPGVLPVRQPAPALTARQSLAFGLSAVAYRFTEGPFDRRFPRRLRHRLPGERQRDPCVRPSCRRAGAPLGGSAAGDLGSYVGSHSNDAFNALFDQTTVYQLPLGETLVFRNPWAIVRLGVLYHGKVMR